MVYVERVMHGPVVWGQTSDLRPFALYSVLCGR